MASYLYNKYEDKLKNKNIQLGNVELLFKLMKRCNVKISTDLIQYLNPLNFNEEVRSICDQIADNIILGNNERYDIYSELKSSDVNFDSELNSVIGEFMREWIRLEAYVSQLTIKKDIRTRPFSPSSLKKIIPEKDLKKVLELRRKRNLIVHGMKLPPAEEIKYMTKEVSNICKSLEDMNRV